MSFNYVIPPQMDKGDYTTPALSRQDVYGHMSMVGQSNAANRIGGHYCGLIDESFPSGIGGIYVKVYNFTDNPIVMVDCANGITILEPISRFDGNGETPPEVLTIDVMYLNQDKRISPESASYLRDRIIALTGCDLPYPAAHGMNGQGEDNYINRANTNRRYRFVVPAGRDTMNKYGGAFYFEEADIVIGTIKDSKQVLIHPKSDDALLAKARPRLEAVKSLGSEIGVNDTAHRYERVFTNVFGSVMEIPITRDPAKPDGVMLWENVHQHNTQPTHYSLDDKDMPVKLFSCRKSAEVGGSPEKLVELQLSQDKLRLAEEKLRHEREDFARTKEREELHAKQAMEKFERETQERERVEQERARERQREHERRVHEERNRERVENVTFWRKFLVEGTKTIAAMATVATIAWTWYMKKKA